jgi:hypothetical protein
VRQHQLTPDASADPHVPQHVLVTAPLEDGLRVGVRRGLLADGQRERAVTVASDEQLSGLVENV